jgi:hypothetical protein
VIVLRGNYNDICKRQQIRWSLVEKRTKLKPCGKKGTFMRYKVSHMEIDCKE